VIQKLRKSKERVIVSGKKVQILIPKRGGQISGTSSSAGRASAVGDAERKGLSKLVNNTRLQSNLVFHRENAHVADYLGHEKLTHTRPSVCARRLGIECGKSLC